MPRHGFAGSKSKPAHHGGSLMKEGFVHDPLGLHFGQGVRVQEVD
jgi:hypothetical protein